MACTFVKDIESEIINFISSTINNIVWFNRVKEQFSIDINIHTKDCIHCCLEYMIIIRSMPRFTSNSYYQIWLKVAQISFNNPIISRKICISRPKNTLFSKIHSSAKILTQKPKFHHEAVLQYLADLMLLLKSKNLKHVFAAKHAVQNISCEHECCGYQKNNLPSLEGHVVLGDRSNEYRNQEAGSTTRRIYHHSDSELSQEW